MIRLVLRLLRYVLEAQTKYPLEHKDPTSRLARNPYDVEYTVMGVVCQENSRAEDSQPPK